MHPATAELLQYFGFEHLPAGRPRTTCVLFSNLAHDMARTLPDKPETTMCLRKLLEAKDCAVRAALPPS